MNIADDIKIICIKKKVSLSELAEKTEQSQPNLTNKLKRNDFKTSELEKIATALNAELNVRFVDKETKQPLN